VTHFLRNSARGTLPVHQGCRKRPRLYSARDSGGAIPVFDEMDASRTGAWCGQRSHVHAGVMPLSPIPRARSLKSRRPRRHEGHRRVSPFFGRVAVRRSTMGARLDALFERDAMQCLQSTRLPRHNVSTFCRLGEAALHVHRHGVEKSHAKKNYISSAV
jgi:hypothetical protein